MSDLDPQEINEDVRDVNEPADGVPPVVDTPEAFAAAVQALAAGTGPVAADAERASGFRYGQATYLVQFRREGSGSFLIDTAVIKDLSVLAEALAGVQWILHAASQDLPGFRDLGVVPDEVFDTELAARLLGWPKVGLAAVLERELGVRLAKEHSAQDWSQRPLPDSWLTYAVLDVEFLIPLAEKLAVYLQDAGKLEWFQQECEAVRLAPPAEPRPEPWRRTSGISQLRTPRELGVAREMWEARDKEARRRDIAPGRIVRDAALISAAQKSPKSVEELTALPEWRGKGMRRVAPRWFSVIEKASALPERALPSRRGPGTDAPPPHRTWKDRHPQAAARLDAARTVVETLTEQYDLPAENLLQPDALRRAAWDYSGQGADGVAAFLLQRSARPWQIELMAAPLATAFDKADQDYKSAENQAQQSSE